MYALVGGTRFFEGVFKICKWKKRGGVNYLSLISGSGFICVTYSLCIGSCCELKKLFFRYQRQKNGQKNGFAEESIYDKANPEILKSLRIKLIFKR